MQIADKIVVPSEWQKRQINNYFPNLSHKVEVVENGISLKEPANHAPRTHLLYVGRIHRMKGIEELLEAVSLLAKGHPEVRLDIIGTGPTYYLNQLKSLVSRLKIKSKVSWLGFIPHQEVQQLYPQYGAVVVPSKQESFGLVALEALANGVPLVSTNSGGLSQFVNQQVAEVIPNVSGIDTARAIINMWNKRELTDLRVINGLLHVSTYDWSEITKKYLAIFAKMLAQEWKAEEITTKTVATNRDWKLKIAWKAKPQGQVWLVQNSRGQQGYFKFASKDQWFFAGPIIANEMIAAALAKRLGFPVAELEEAIVYGPTGESKEESFQRLFRRKR